ncbi:hypothetical protein E5676_scaffold1112G00410 [Cucumis melo var. makuwa]|uniref:DUF4218 domain-containing protein n=1 Tax=Cucumis melo var. makuwa TaxID=1194695 RepID=A0A5D3BMS7_CUCMM|nr:hypothetical protein E6C27_scaffold417G00960 [Cucumis melo var. makuwa]TYK00375.1 hypothetical protein E5676_scaffold1112G00410 [Cucumis melo var. makuwa]
MIFSSGKKCGKNNNEGGNDYWKRRSEFFELPYWKNLHVRHCLDVMHIEKNVCMNIVGTLLDLPGKSKDGMNSRLDLVEMNIRPELAPMVTELDALQEDIVMTFCNLEKYFPPSFYTIMVHMVVHLVRKVKLCVPVYLRWMYPFERYMKVLKSFVRNRNRPEGCIAEAQVDKGLNKAKGNPMAFYRVLPQSIGAMKPWIRQLVDVVEESMDHGIDQVLIYASV